MDAAEELRLVTQRFFRRFGAFAGDATPCGKPITMVHAHALMILSAQGVLSQQQLGLELCIDKSNVTRLCAKMVEAGFRSPLGENDLRAKLTPPARLDSRHC